MSDAEGTFQDARRIWREALRDHVLAPPDGGFSARLAALASAASQRAAACEAAYLTAPDGTVYPTSTEQAEKWLQAASARRTITPSSGAIGAACECSSQ